VAESFWQRRVRTGRAQGLSRLWKRWEALTPQLAGEGLALGWAAAAWQPLRGGWAVGHRAVSWHGAKCVCWQARAAGPARTRGALENIGRADSIRNPHAEAVWGGWWAEHKRLPAKAQPRATKWLVLVFSSVSCHWNAPRVAFVTELETAAACYTLPRKVPQGRLPGTSFYLVSCKTD